MGAAQNRLAVLTATYGAVTKGSGTTYDLSASSFFAQRHGAIYGCGAP
jgi:hypothetical protein